MSKSTSTIQGQISNSERSISEAMELCVEVAGQPDYEINFSLQSFEDGLQMMDLKEWRVKVSKGIEVLNEVTKALELESMRRTYHKPN